MAGDANEFDTWLTNQLRSSNIDEEVYFEYIKGILEEESTEEELKDTLTEILSGVLETQDAGTIAGDIYDYWQKTTKKSDCQQENDMIASNAEEKIKSIIEHQQNQVTVVEKSTKIVDNEMKRLVLSQFQNLSDSEEERATSDTEEHKEPSEFKNVNAETVAQKQQLEREKQKKASEEKKQLDKINREKEKLKKEERQEKEKKRTQKGERKSGR